MTEPNDVLVAIRLAFPTAPIPKVAVNAPEPFKTEAAAFARTLQGKTWTSVTLSDLRDDLFGIFRIDDKSYRYYLSAYLSFAMTDYHRMDFVVETLLQSLTSPDYGGRRCPPEGCRRKARGRFPPAAGPAAGPPAADIEDHGLLTASRRPPSMREARGRRPVEIMCLDVSVVKALSPASRLFWFRFFPRGI